jgi:thiol:disulfide interchange protein DsbA
MILMRSFEQMHTRIAILLLPLLLLLGGVAQATDFVEGKDYARLAQEQPAAGKGKVQVVELFWYGCPHCFSFDPHIAKWQETKPDYVEFVQMPAIFSNKRWKLHAAAFYTAEVLGVLDKIHEPLFKAIHEQHKKLANESELADFFEQYGVSKDEFNKTINSFAVEAKVRRAADMTRRYGITGVPVIIVNGKYRVDGPMAKSYENMIRIVNALVQKEAEAEKLMALGQ